MSAASPLKQPPTGVVSPTASPAGTKVKSRQSPDSGVAINSSTHSSFSSRDSSSLSPHATTGGEDPQDATAIGSVGTSASSPQKRSKSLSEYSSDIQSSPSATATLSSTSFGFSTESQVNTTSGVYSSSSSVAPLQRQRLYSAPNIKGMQPLSHAPTMMSTKHSPTMNHFSLPRGYGQMTQPPPYGHYQGYPGYGGYATAAGASYQSQTPFSPTYNNYPTGAVAGSPYLVHPGPPGSTLYSVNARPPAYPSQQTSAAVNMSSGYFPYSTTSTCTGLPTPSTGAMTTQQSVNYSTTTGYPTGYNGTTSSGGSTMFSQPPTATTTVTGLNSISEQQNVLPVATTSSVCDVSPLELPSSLTTTTGDLDTSHDSATSDSSFPVVSLPSSSVQHQTSLSELDSQGGSPEANGASRDTPGEVPVMLSMESHASNDSPDTSTKTQVNGGNCDKDQVYTKRSVSDPSCYTVLSKQQDACAHTRTYRGHLLYVVVVIE